MLRRLGASKIASIAIVMFENKPVAAHVKPTNATNPNDFDLRLKGITGAADRWGDKNNEKEDDAPETPDWSENTEIRDMPGFNKF